MLPAWSIVRHQMAVERGARTEQYHLRVGHMLLQLGDQCQGEWIRNTFPVLEVYEGFAPGLGHDVIPRRSWPSGDRSAGHVLGMAA